jgi:hypothetical protein
MPKHKHDAVTSQFREWLDDGVTENCPMASPWNMGLVVVAKASEPGAPLKNRVFIDPRPVNAVTPNDPHPLSYILDYLDDACGAEVFSSLDLKFDPPILGVSWPSGHSVIYMAEHSVPL